MKTNLCRAAGVLAAILLASALAVAAGDARTVFVLTSTNEASSNYVVVFKLDTTGAPSLSLVDMLPTGGKGGASGNAGILQFRDGLGAVANYGSNTVSQLVRDDDSIRIGSTIKLATGCMGPDSVALKEGHLFVVGANCAESHAWPWGNVDGTVVKLTDSSAAQIAVGGNWAAVTMKGTTSGSVLQLPLTPYGALNGMSTTIMLPSMANNTPLGEAFWGNILGFTPAHSPDSFAIVNASGTVYPVVGPAPPYPTNAPCWVAKGPASVWYTSNSPGQAISIFFSDSQGGTFYKSIPLPGPPTDLTVSRDRKWLAVMYNYNSEGYIAVYSIDAYGNLTYAATSPSSADLPTSISGMAFSQ